MVKLKEAMMYLQEAYSWSWANCWGDRYRHLAGMTSGWLRWFIKANKTPRRMWRPCVTRMSTGREATPAKTIHHSKTCRLSRKNWFKHKRWKIDSNERVKNTHFSNTHISPHFFICWIKEHPYRNRKHKSQLWIIKVRNKTVSDTPWYVHQTGIRN